MGMPYNLTPEERVALVEECRKAERILKLHWLVQRRRDVARFLAEVDVEIGALKLELKGRRLPGRRLPGRVVDSEKRRIARLQDGLAMEASLERVERGEGAAGDAAAAG